MAFPAPTAKAATRHADEFQRHRDWYRTCEALWEVKRMLEFNQEQIADSSKGDRSDHPTKDASNPAMPRGWTAEKESLFLRCARHAADCRERAKRRSRFRAFAWHQEPLETDEDRFAFNSMFDRVFADERIDRTLRRHMRENVEKFELLYTALYVFLGKRVCALGREGVLLTVHATQCEVQPDGSLESFRAKPSEISWCK
jgi:hypothetical protein